MADLSKYLYIPESELTEQLKFSIIKSRAIAKTDQMPYKIYEDKRKKNVPVVNLFQFGTTWYCTSTLKRFSGS